MRHKKGWLVLLYSFNFKQNSDNAVRFCSHCWCLFGVGVESASSVVRHLVSLPGKRNGKVERDEGIRTESEVQNMKQLTKDALQLYSRPLRDVGWRARVFCPLGIPLKPKQPPPGRPLRFACHPRSHWISI